MAPPSPNTSPTIRPRLGPRSTSQLSPLTTPNKLPLNPTYSNHEASPLPSTLPLPLAPLSPPPTITKASMPSSLAMRRMRKQDSDHQAAQSLISERPTLKRGHSVNPSSEPRAALRINTIQAASAPMNRHSSPRSAGMTRSYSSPVATQSELDEQRRIMEVAASSPHQAKAFWTYGFSGFSSPGQSPSPLKSSTASSLPMATSASPISIRSALGPSSASGNITETISESPIPPQPVFLRKPSTFTENHEDTENVAPKEEIGLATEDSEMSYFSPRQGSGSGSSISDDEEATTPTLSTYSSPFVSAQNSVLKKQKGMQVSQAPQVVTKEAWAPYEGYINPAHLG